MTDLCEVKWEMPDPITAIGNCHRCRPFINPAFEETVQVIGNDLVFRILPVALPKLMNFLKHKGIIK